MYLRISGWLACDAERATALSPDRIKRNASPAGQDLHYLIQCDRACGVLLEPVLGLDARAAKLAGFVAGEKDNASSFLSVSFKHGPGFRPPS